MMGKVLLIGEGPPPADAHPKPPESFLKYSSFPTLRLWQGLRALLIAGHKPVVFSSHPGASNQIKNITLHGQSFPWLTVEPGEMFPSRIRELIDCYQVKCVATLGPFTSMAMAGFVPQKYPLFVDIPGDPMAEAQLRAEDGLSHLNRYRRVLLAALLRGDYFSVCSRPQRHALLGQLGLMGRLIPGENWQKRTHIIPPGIENSWLISPEKPRNLHKKPTIVIFGGTNHWMAVDDTIKALNIALNAHPETRVQVFGGLIPGFAESVFKRFKGQIGKQKWHKQVQFHGWISQQELLLHLDQATVALNLDRPSIEGELGARTRLLLGVCRKLPWVLTEQCEDSKTLIHLGLAKGAKAGDFSTAGQLLIQILTEQFRQSPHLTDFINSRSPSQLMDSLVRFVEAPKKAAPGIGSAEHALLDAKIESQAALEEIYQSPSWRTLNHLHRFLLKAIRR